MNENWEYTCEDCAKFNNCPNTSDPKQKMCDDAECGYCLGIDCYGYVFCDYSTKWMPGEED